MTPLYELARMTVTGAPGVGSITLNAAVVPWLTFALAGVPNGARITYGILDSPNSEISVGTYNAGILTRDRCIRSTNGNAFINATAQATIYIDASFEDFLGSLYFANAMFGRI